MSEKEIPKLTTEWVHLSEHTTEVRIGHSEGGVTLLDVVGHDYTQAVLTIQDAIALGKVAEAWLAEQEQP